ncbi:TPA: hypothetical protein NKQ36_003772 [Vibrio parahaemolyticus]|nr:hypothetical protein [Vibrio parahaemolyticus]HCH1592593.1 hypothetical protein [Vibrio parahaemolyticus]
MRIILGLLSFVGGIVIWGLAISALISWLAFCFGSIIIGVLLLIFAPYILLAPLAIGTPGTALFVYGMVCIANRKEDSIFVTENKKIKKSDSVTDKNVVWERSSNNLKSIEKIINESKKDH